ncbi:restriction endonuclease subunit S [Alcaligenes aquatilis]|uniref:restriction endonuclease subunit S n=1 Tax=Alcaligenes aquatilis TaxID=323284 RepID=UPI0038737415
MNSEWPIVRLGDLVDSCLGKMLDAKKNKGVNQPYLGNSNVRWGNFHLTDLAEMRFEPKEEARYSLEPGDLVVCEGGEPGRCAIWTGEKGMKIQKALHRIRPKAALNNYYLFYWFLNSAKTGLLEPYFTGTTIKHLTGKAVAALELPLPPLSVQVATVEVLKPLDDRITLLRETNKTLESIAQAIFKSWFMDFDPVRAKMEGRQPEGMDEETAALFPDSFEKSEVGLIPKGWVVGEVKDLGEVICGKTPATRNSEYYGNEIPFVTIPDMHNNLLITTTNRSLSKKGADSQSKKYLRKGSICISCIATPGLVSQITSEAQTNQQINSVVPFAKWGDNFTLFTLRLIGEAVKSAGSGGSVFHNLSKSRFETLTTLLPDTLCAQTFNLTVTPIIEKITINQYQIQSLSDIRDTLLPRLISGQLRLPEAQEKVESALS